MKPSKTFFTPCIYIVIINDYKEEEHIENKTIETKVEAKQLVEAK